MYFSGKELLWVKVKGVELILPFLPSLLLMFSSGDNELFCDSQSWILFLGDPEC